jgi:hypothetical protein
MVRRARELAARECQRLLNEVGKVRGLMSLLM